LGFANQVKSAQQQRYHEDVLVGRQRLALVGVFAVIEMISFI
jgi:hypothetical protein